MESGTHFREVWHPNKGEHIEENSNKCGRNDERKRIG
jgi:hypothetical protein